MYGRASACRTLAAPTVLTVGNASRRKSLRVTSAKAAGKATVAKPFLRTARKMFGHQHCCCVVNCGDAPHLRLPTSSACCFGLITARNALR